MATARAIQVSVTHISLGVFLGAAIEAIMPAHSASSSNAALVFESFVQVALNGVALAQVGDAVSRDDPTFGLPFSLGLFEAQPGLQKRIALLAGAAKAQVTQAAQRMLPHAPEAESPSQ